VNIGTGEIKIIIKPYAITDSGILATVKIKQQHFVYQNIYVTQLRILIKNKK
jgi:hypothetical protein